MPNELPKTMFGMPVVVRDDLPPIPAMRFGEYVKRCPLVVNDGVLTVAEGYELTTLGIVRSGFDEIG